MSDIGVSRDVNYIGKAQANNIVINSGDHFHPGAASGSNTVRQDVFRPSFQAPANPREVILDFGNPLDGTEPQTQEAKVLYELLREDRDPSETRVVTVHGKGGVGKSCILRALARNEQLKKQFPDGIYFLSLGMDANMGTLIQGLAKITRLSGGNVLGAELRREDNFEIAVEKVREWMEGKTILLLVDDFWEENGLGAHVVTELAQMFSYGSGSMAVVTTRFIGVTTKGDETVEIKELEMMSEKAKDILLGYSKFDWEGIDQGQVRPAFITLLKLCGGLPVFLAIVGKAVAKIALRFRSKRERGSAWEECLNMVEGSELLETKVDDYKDLGRTLHMSLKVLSEDCGKVIEALSPYSLSEIHRAFCVFKKQEAIPMSVCRRLWKVESDSAALKIGIAFADVGLADIEIERNVKVLRLHDLVHIFAVECAKDKNEVSLWHKRLLEGYISQAEGRDSVRLWWEFDEEGDGEEYLFENLCRHLASSGNVTELVRLLMSGQWTQLRHVHGGLPAWKRDFSQYLGREITSALTEHEEEIEKGLRIVRDAVVEIWVFVRDNPQELGYQIFGRLVDCENEVVGKYLESIERLQYGTWLKPIQRCFVRPGEGGMIAELDLGGYIRDIAVQRDKSIAVAALGNEIAILDLDEMKEINRCIEPIGWFKKLGISNDGKRVYSLSDNCIIRQWDIQSGEEDMDKCVRLNDEEGDDDDWVSCAVFCPVKSTVITGSAKGRVKVWDLCTGENIGRTMDAYERVTCIGVSPCGDIIVAGVYGLTLLLWDAQTGTPLGVELKGDLGIVGSIGFSPDGGLVVSCGLNHEDNTIRLWDVENGTQIGSPFAVCRSPPYSITFSEYGRQIISGHLDGSIAVWNAASGESIRLWKAHAECVMFVTVMGDVGSRRAVSGGGDRAIRVWDLQAAANVEDEPAHHNGDVIRVATSPCGRFFLSKSVDETLLVWDGADGTPVGGIRCVHDLGFTCFAVSTGGGQLVTGSWDGRMRIWDVATGGQVGDTIQGHDDYVMYVAYSTNDRFVVSKTEDGTFRVWRVADNSQSDGCVDEYSSNRVRLVEPGVCEPLLNQTPLWLEMTLQLNEKLIREHEVTCVAVSPAGNRVLSGSLDGLVRVWDASSGRCIFWTSSNIESQREIVRIEISERNEVVTTNGLYQEVRWQLNDEGGLTELQESEDETGVKIAKSQGPLSEGLDSIVCEERRVQMSFGDRKIATLPDDVWDNAWKYDPQRRVLCVGLRDGRVLFFRVEC